MQLDCQCGDIGWASLPVAGLQTLSEPADANDLRLVSDTVSGYSLPLAVSRSTGPGPVVATRIASVDHEIFVE